MACNVFSLYDILDRLHCMNKSKHMNNIFKNLIWKHDRNKWLTNLWKRTWIIFYEHLHVLHYIKPNSHELLCVGLWSNVYYLKQNLISSAIGTWKKLQWNTRLKYLLLEIFWPSVLFSPACADLPGVCMTYKP